MSEASTPMVLKIIIRASMLNGSSSTMRTLLYSTLVKYLTAILSLTIYGSQSYTNTLESATYVFTFSVSMGILSS
jgi:hypothetical protein